jgi:hypothetical protein
MLLPHAPARAHGRVFEWRKTASLARLEGLSRQPFGSAASSSTDRLHARDSQILSFSPTSIENP